MAKILKIVDEIISVGNDDGTLTEIRVQDCNFNPNVGDEVNIFTSENQIVCTKAEPKKEIETMDILKNGGININVTQNQNSNNKGVPEMYCNVGSKRAVNKILYIILALFFGFIGVHKFYSGKPGQGILYLLFCWTYIPAVIAFVEAIVACCQTADSYGRILV